MATGGGMQSGALLVLLRIGAGTSTAAACRGERKMMLAKTPSQGQKDTFFLPKEQLFHAL